MFWDEIRKSAKKSVEKLTYDSYKGVMEIPTK